MLRITDLNGKVDISKKTAYNNGGCCITLQLIKNGYFIDLKKQKTFDL